MPEKHSNNFDLISATIPIRSLRPLWGVLTDLDKLTIRNQLFENYNLSKARLMSDERIPLATIQQIFTYCEQHSLTEAGFLTGVSGEFGQFGILDYYLASTPSIGDMLKNLLKYFSLLTTEKPLLTITHSNDEIINLSLPKSDNNVTGDKLFNEMLLGMIIRTIYVNSGKANILPKIISFPYKNLPRSIVIYLTDKKIKIQLGKNEYQLIYPDKILSIELQYRDSLIVNTLKSTLDKLLLKTQQEQSLSAQVVDIFNRAADLSRLSLISVAEELAMSQSSLKRKLADEDSSFSFLLARFKQSRSMEMVTSSKLTLSQIADALGYADRTAFERAFKDWFGVTPSQIRQQASIANLPNNSYSPIEMDSFPSAPDIFMKLMSLLDDDNSTIKDISELIESDPVLTGKLLGIAGSAYYGYREVTNISNAISELFGLDQTRNYVLSILSNNQFDTSQCKFLDLQLYWTHATATYECIKILAESMDFKNKAELECFLLAALLHRIFELVYASQRPKDMEQYLSLLQNSDLSLSTEICQEIETQIFGMTGYQTTTLLLSHWGIPVDVHKIIREMSLDKDKQSLKAKVLNYVSETFRFTIYSQADDKQKDDLLNNLSEILYHDYDDLQQKINGVANSLAEIKEQARSMY